MSDRLKINSLKNFDVGSATPHECDSSRTISLTPRQMESLEILNGLFEEEHKPNAVNPELIEVQ